MLAALRRHWPEYIMEAAGLGAFMVAAAVFGALLEAPGSPLRAALPDALLRRALMGLAMGLTAIAIIHSPWGRRSGAHINPGVTLTYFRLGRIAGADAVFYALAQCAGALGGVLLAAALLGRAVSDPPVNFVATLPGPRGAGPAFAAELLISFALMFTVLAVSNSARWSRLTGLCAGALVALWITFEAPLSGMSMNPARSLGSALPAHVWTDFWIYLVAPPLGMLAAAQVFVGWRGLHSVLCAKLLHHGSQRCIFRCGWCSDAANADPARSADITT